MFDSLFVECPVCHSDIEFQSKAHNCNLKRYSIYNVPPEIALDCRYDTKICPKCNNEIRLLVEMLVQVKPYIE